MSPILSLLIITSWRLFVRSVGQGFNKNLIWFSLVCSVAQRCHHWLNVCFRIMLSNLGWGSFGRANSLDSVFVSYFVAKNSDMSRNLHQQNILIITSERRNLVLNFSGYDVRLVNVEDTGYGIHTHTESRLEWRISTFGLV